MLQEFKQIILRGNVIDLAVAVVIGAAFGAIVTSLFENIITPIIGAIGGQVVKPMNAIMTRMRTEPTLDSLTGKCPFCLSEVQVGATRCPFCTQEITAVAA
jgi:large conductance mechanosensitive channel